MSSSEPQLPFVLELLSADHGHVYFSGVIEQVVIHPVVPPADPDHLLEQLTPEDLVWAVRRSRLVQHACGVVGVGERHQQLKISFPQIFQIHFVQRAAGFNPVGDGCG